MRTIRIKTKPLSTEILYQLKIFPFLDSIIASQKLDKYEVIRTPVDSVHESLDLAWQDQGLSLEHFGDVEVKEVDVEDGLNDTSNNSNGVEEAFSVVAVNPVENVKSTIHTQHEEIVTGDGFSLPGLGHHEQLRENSASLEVDRESPENLSDGERVVEDQGQDHAGSEQELHTERVVVAVVRRLELHEYQIAGPDAA